ncbi:predicted protein [Uncinocarpus reesii 1704]|uniref:Uncharacterized protein n=1 Tax=Uncinocarpus reesii (strain UAMH 1704) TaxID=336963 RepID=C4JUT3_UNCRE|nr:uncharacterized protein UREG_04886 [Uncinocarpus reesii 1704]EEP80044.1 predicted protein [Uncinocarpus reesii 1704]
MTSIAGSFEQRCCFERIPSCINASKGCRGKGTNGIAFGERFDAEKQNEQES